MSFLDSEIERLRPEIGGSTIGVNAIGVNAIGGTIMEKSAKINKRMIMPPSRVRLVLI